MKNIVPAAVLLAFILISGCANTQYRVKVSWNEPVDGGEVNRYVLQLNSDGSGWKDFRDVGTSLYWVGALPENHSYYFRVVGFDSLNRIGKFSPVSDVVVIP